MESWLLKRAFKEADGRDGGSGEGGKRRWQQETGMRARRRLSGSWSGEVNVGRVLS